LDPSSSHAPFGATDPGFPASPAAELIAQNADLVARLKTCYGADQDTFDREILHLIDRYAAYVHLLPATADNYFCAPGGLFRLGLEVAFFSLQGTDAHIFSGRSTISARRHLEPRWRLATFVAGLCCECHRAISHLLIADAAGDQWSGYMGPLADWLARAGASRYYVRWRPQATEIRSLGVFALPHVVPADVMRHLAEDNAVIVPQLMASISGVALYRDHNVLDELVRRSLALVIDRNLAASADRYGKPQFGSHLERYLVDAMRRLASHDSAWAPNREKSRVWYANDGVFLTWPAAAEDIRRVLDDDQLRGIPKSSETMLEILLAAGVVSARDANRPCWTIRPPGAKAPQDAVRLASPALLFTSVAPVPTPLPEDVGAEDVRGPHTASAYPQDPGPAPTPAGTQLSLIPSPDPSQTQPDSPSQAVEQVPGPGHIATPSPPLTLRAPMRLNPVVRDALALIVATLNADCSPAHCCTIAEGLFVPLDQFERRGVPAAVALRALVEVRLLIRTSRAAKGPPTHSRDFNGVPTTGLVIHPRAIEGFDLSAFAVAPQQEV
jgi:conjugal transfer pilus assembly protein TraI